MFVFSLNFMYGGRNITHEVTGLLLDNRGNITTVITSKGRFKAGPGGVSIEAI